MSGVGFLPTTCLSAVTLRPLTTISAIATVLNHLPELDDAILLLKSPHALVTGQGEKELVLPTAFPLCG